MKVLLCYAMSIEMGDLRLPTNVHGLCTGIGEVNTALRLTRTLMEQDYDVILNIGFVGSDSLPVGTLCNPVVSLYRDYETDVYDHREVQFSLQSFDCEGVPVSCYTGASFYRGELLKLSSDDQSKLPRVYDMELATICQAVHDLGRSAPVYSLKVVSDCCSLSEYEAFSLSDLKDVLYSATERVLKEII